MKMRKIFGICLVLLLGVSMLAIAAGNSSQQSSSSGGPTTIRVWTNDAHNKLECDNLVEKFNNGVGAQKGIKVEYTVYGADWQTAMNLAIETGREPEIFKGVANMGNFQQQGKLLPWKEIPGIDHILKNQEPYHRNQTSVFDGDVYSVIIYGWYTGLHYNKSLLQRAGFSAPPKTWAEFEQQATAISQLEPGKIYGYAMPLVWSPDFQHWLVEYWAAMSVGHPYYNATQDKYQFVDYTPYYEMLSRMNGNNVIFPGMESLSDDQQRAQFAAGNIGFIGGAGWNVGVLYEQFPFGSGSQSDMQNGWDYTPLPLQDPNTVFAQPVSAGASVFVSAQVRNDRDKLNKVGDVLNLFVGDEIQTVMFTNGKNIPLRPDITSTAPPNTDRPQWSSYGKTLGAAITLPGMPHDYLTPEGADRTAIFSQILTGQIRTADIRSALTDLDTRYNAALQQAYTRGVINRADFVDPTQEARFKTK